MPLRAVHLTRRTALFSGLLPGLASACLLALAGMAGAADSTSPPADPAPAARAARIAFVGDSMVDGIWGGFVRLTGDDACLKAAVELGRYGENGTGLSRPDHFDWPASMGKIVAAFKPDLVVISLGLNDRQSLVDKERVRTDFSAPNYAERYGIQVKAMINAAVASGAGLMWVGLPVLRDRAADADARAKNQIFRQTITAYGKPAVEYVEPWKLSADSNDYAANGPNTAGSLVSLRASDGIHFTGAGYDLIASYLLPKVKAHLQAAGFKFQDTCIKG